MPVEVAAAQRRREQDARVAVAIVELDRDDQLLPGECLRLREFGSAAVGEREAPGAARTAQRDAIRVGEGEQETGVRRSVRGGRTGGELSLEIARQAAYAPQRLALGAKEARRRTAACNWTLVRCWGR